MTSSNSFRNSLPLPAALIAQAAVNASFDAQDAFEAARLTKRPTPGTHREVLQKRALARRLTTAAQHATS